MSATAKRGFHSPMDFVRGAEEPPPSPQPAVEPANDVAAGLAKPAAVPVAKQPSAAVAPQAQAPLIPSRRRPPTRPSNVRIPETLHEELRQFMKDTDIPMTEVIIEGTRQRLAELKKLYGLE